MQFFQEFKLLLLDAVPLTRDGFHIYLGMVAYLGACMVFRRPMSHVWMLLAPLMAAVLLEGADLMADIDTYGYMRWHASLKDIINTVLAPLTTFIVARWRR